MESQKRPPLTDGPVVIEPRPPNTYEPPKVPEEDLERIEREKKREAQVELKRLVQNALEEEEKAKQEARRKEEERIQFWHSIASIPKGVVGVCNILLIIFVPALLFEGIAYEGVVKLVNFLCQCWADLIFSLSK